MFYEHLKPKSVRVKPGQKVKKGEVIAQIGFTGQSMGPHLHFHVADRNSPLGAEGIPFVFENFEIIGSLPADLAGFGDQKWMGYGAGPGIRKRELPPPNSVIRIK